MYRKCVLHYWFMYRKWMSSLVYVQEVYVIIDLCIGNVLHDWFMYRKCISIMIYAQEKYCIIDLCTGSVPHYWFMNRKWTALLINAQEVYVNIGLCTGSVLHDWECTAVLPASSPRQCSRNPVLLVLLLAGLADVCKQLVYIKQV